ncbi:MAG: tubulin-like doman-containing protein, partial [Clostridiales bacterium]|nr:tubulin-like doman-containing protein [Clostridiales bacterium]
MADNGIKQIIEAFRELDINTGNGLIGESRLFEPSKRAIFIGIGGTGNYALRKLKRIVYQRYKNIGERFGFIGVDTDLRQEKPHKDYMLLDSDEQFPLEAEKFFFDPAKYHLLPDYIREWLNEDISFTVTGEGAGGFRAAARALLFHSADEFLRKLQNVSNRIRRGDLQANVDVFILAGVGGGTGSGTMLDIAYIVRKVLSDVKKRIHGFIFMPDINLSETLPQATRSYIAPNAFAALKEIDYWMNIRSRSDVFRQKYSASLDIEDYNPPFDYCWPITATNTNGVYVSDALKQSATVAAETICAWISYRDEKDITGAGQDTFITSFASNIEKMTKIYVKNLNAKSPGRTYPVSFGYTVCGASVAKLPVAAINTYLACILFKRFNDIYNKSFDEKIGEDLSSFCNDATVGISPDKLKSALETEFNMLGVRQPKLSEKKWEELFENDADRPLEYYLNQVAEKTAEVQMKVISSKKEVLSAKLKEMFIDETKGPYYLNSFIQNGNSGLIFLLDGYVNSLMTEKSNLQQREQEMARRKAEAYKNGKNAIFFMRGSHVTEYSGAIKRFYDVKKDQLLCDAAIGVYKELQQILAKRVSASYNASYALLDALSKTFRNNIEAFKSKVNVEKKGNYTEYSWDIFTLPEIVELVTDTLAQKGINEQKQTEILKSMLYEFLQIIDKEIGRNSAIGDLNSAPLQKLDVGGFLADFVSRHFKELTDKTMKQYMEMKAGEEGLNAYLVRQFQRMEQESAPLFFSQPDKAYT